MDAVLAMNSATTLMTSHTTAGSKVEKPLTAHGYYSGSVDNEPNTFAHVAVQLDGTVQGIIVDANGEVRYR
jgi:hypothetical protein